MEPISNQELAQKRFMQVFKFDQDDLLANRKGNLGQSQKKRVLNQGILALSIVGFVGVLVAYIFLVFVDIPISKIPLEVVVGVILTLASMGTWFSWIYWKTYTLGTVDKLTGKVSWQSGRYSIYLCVGDRRVPVSMGIDGLFDQDGIYNIYYAPLIRLVVAVEQVS